MPVSVDCRSRAAAQARRLAVGAAVLPWAVVQALAQDAAPAEPAPPQPLGKVVVIGSNLGRENADTPSPVQVISAGDIKRSGYTSVADVLHNITGNNMGSLSQSAPTSSAPGGAGIALRGLTVGATLVLIDGHRMAPYPFPDDGSRDFVDIASIPMEAVERIEVLKDGASAIYGSDAIAGVVNVILKRSHTGTTLSADAGRTSHGDGSTRNLSLSTGWGDLEADGRSVYIAFEASHQDAILLKDRPNLTLDDWRPYGGADLAQGTSSGAASGASSGGGSGTGYLADASGKPVYFYPGCNTTAAAADKCGYTNPFITLQPETRHTNLLLGATGELGAGWQLNLQSSALRSETRQVSLYNNAYATGVGSGGNGGGVNLFRFGPGVGPTPAFPAQFPFVLTVPANAPGNPLGTAAPLVYDFPDLGPLTQDVVSTSYRTVAELSGSLGDWELNAAAGSTRVVSAASFYNDIDFPALQSALDDGSYRVGGQPGGSSGAALHALVAPAAQSTSSSALSFLSLRASRDLMRLAGGPLAFSTGADFTHHALVQQYPASFANGIQNLGIYAFAVGQQNVAAADAELVAPLTRAFELDAAARVDRYDTYGHSTTPKLGFKLTPWEGYTLRGTYGHGFRAPSPAETGQAGGTSGFVGGYHDPLWCPGGPSASGSNAPNPACNIALQELQLATKGLKPERSTSTTLGFIAEPVRDLRLQLDYYRITLRDQIISVGELGQLGLDDAARLGTTIYRDAAGNILYDTYPYINADTTSTSGLDLDLQGTLHLPGSGRLKAELQVTTLLSYDLSAQGVTYHLAGTHGPSFISEDTGTPRTRASFTLTWSHGPVELSGTLNFISRFGVTDPSEGISDCATALANEFPNGKAPQAFCHVGSFTELNLTGRYDLNPRLQLHAGVVNLLNRRAPYDLQTFGSAGNGPQQGGAPYNPSLHQDGAVGPAVTVGATYNF